jgi:hypothetical protein
LENISHLRNLKELAISGPADPCGAKHLGRLENLERLDWTLLRESNPEPPSEGAFFRTELEQRMYDDFMVNPMKFMESVFEGFSRLPTMTVEVARDGFPDRLW